MTYSLKDLQRLREEYATIPHKKDLLWNAYLDREYTAPIAKEFAEQGFLRRVGIMARCITNVFEGLPPDQVEVPGTDTRHDAEINVQSFVLNTFGATDNLAHIWVKEKAITGKDGKRLDKLKIGLRLKNKCVRESFSLEFREYLESLDTWFDYLVEFRDALAHRIPLYIPPYSVTQENYHAYADLERRGKEALFVRNDVSEYESLNNAQDKLRVFKALMTHSFEEDGGHVAFHTQMLADFNTIYELGERLLGEFD